MAGAQERKKARERWFLDSFKRAYAGFPEGSIECSEGPDFLVRSGGRTLGVELQEYARGGGAAGSPEREKEMFQDRVAVEAGRIYERWSSIPLNVGFLWNPIATRHNGTVGDLAANAARIVARYIPPESGGQAWLGWDELRGSPLENAVHLIHILRLPAGRENFWRSGESGGIDVEPDELQGLIDRKDGKVAEYLRKCDSVWLLITQSNHISGSAHLTDAVRSHSFRSRFARVFVFDHWKDQVTELTVAP